MGNPETSDVYGEEPQPPAEEEPDDKVRGHWDQRLNDFQKLVFIKAFREEKVIFRLFKLIHHNTNYR